MLGWLEKKFCDTDAEHQGSLEYMLEKVEEQKARVLWVKTEEQRADRQTKFIPV